MVVLPERANIFVLANQPTVHQGGIKYFFFFFSFFRIKEFSKLLFSHRVAMSVCGVVELWSCVRHRVHFHRIWPIQCSSRNDHLYIYIYLYVPSPCNFLAWTEYAFLRGPSPPSRGALKTGKNWTYFSYTQSVKCS